MLIILTLAAILAQTPAPAASVGETSAWQAQQDGRENAIDLRFRWERFEWVGGQHVVHWQLRSRYKATVHFTLELVEETRAGLVKDRLQYTLAPGQELEDPRSWAICRRIVSSRVVLEEIRDTVLDTLDLAPDVRMAAEELKAKHPELRFLSGRRSVAQQARAMAANILAAGDRKWIQKVYRSAAKLQQWIDEHPEAVSLPEIARGLEETMNNMTELERRQVSGHLTGRAFDLQPPTQNLEQVKADILALPGLKQFLEREGGLVRWHLQF